MSNELLSPSEMTRVDLMAAEQGPFDGMALMRNAGAAVAALVLARYPSADRFHVLCGPGNNGGDGYIVARLLLESGCAVSLWNLGKPRHGSAAAIAAAECPAAMPISEFMPQPGSIIVDALYGAGLSKPLEGEAASAVQRVTGLNLPLIAVDLPSGVSGDSGQILGSAFRAEVTVTFARKKPGHLLLPGREMCGEVVVADIGIGDALINQVETRTFENTPNLWLPQFPSLAIDTHKYKRGHACVFSGGPHATGAARLSALAAARSGAGAVTVLSPPNALLVNAAHLTSIMLHSISNVVELRDFLTERRPSACVLGPGFGIGEKAREFALAIMGDRKTRPENVKGLVLDADAITSFRDAPASLFIATGAHSAPALVLTPHEGEFSRLFSDLAADENLSKLDKARKAAARSHGVIVYKGSDTVIAAPDGRAAINANGTPWLATAGSGDVLAGLIGGMLAQGMTAFEAACAGVWLHAEAGRRFGPGLIAEDLPEALLPVFRELTLTRSDGAAAVVQPCLG